MADEKDEGYEKFLQSQKAEQQPGSVLDRPRPFTKPPKGAQLAVVIMLLVAVAIFVFLRVSLWMGTGR